MKRRSAISRFRLPSAAHRRISSSHESGTTHNRSANIHRTITLVLQLRIGQSAHLNPALEAVDNTKRRFIAKAECVRLECDGAKIRRLVCQAPDLNSEIYS